MALDEVVRKYLKELIPAQEAVSQHRERINDLRRDARSEGLSQDALNALLPILTKYPVDKAEIVLNEMMRYAKIYGVKNVGSPTEAIEDRLAVQPGDTRVQHAKTWSDQDCLVGQRKFFASHRIDIGIECGAALVIASGLVWLLN